MTTRESLTQPAIRDCPRPSPHAMRQVGIAQPRMAIGEMMASMVAMKLAPPALVRLPTAIIVRDVRLMRIATAVVCAFPQCEQRPVEAAWTVPRVAMPCESTLARRRMPPSHSMMPNFMKPDVMIAVGMRSVAMMTAQTTGLPFGRKPHEPHLQHGHDRSHEPPGHPYH